MLWAACLSIAAGLLHGLNVQEHLREWWGYGLFFLLAAAGQLMYGIALVVRPWDYDASGGPRDGSRYARSIYLAGAVATCIFIALYLVTRTVGIPLLGPAAGQTEPVSAIGVVTKLLEGGLVYCLVSARRVL